MQLNVVKQGDYKNHLLNKINPDRKNLLGLIICLQRSNFCLLVGETCGLPRANTVRPYRVLNYFSVNFARPSVECFFCKTKTPPLWRGSIKALPMSRKQIKIQRRMILCQRLPCGKGAGSAKLTEGLFCVDYRFLQSLRHGKPCTADCQASATPQNASKGESHPKHFLGLRLIDKTIFCKVSLSKE